MRPSGGYTPEMYNYSQETDVYKIWADMVAFDCNTKPSARTISAPFTAAGTDGATSWTITRS